MAIKVSVRSLWHNRAGIRDRYIKEALAKKEDLLLVYYGENMLIPFGEIESRIIGKSEHAFPDQFSDEFHFLFYFKWNPSNTQQKLL